MAKATTSKTTTKPAIKSTTTKTVSKTKDIGLATTDMAKTIDGLNTVLANYHLFYMNVRGYHWNVKGSDFFTLHVKFEELYNALQLQIDAIAERILTLRGTPMHAYSDFSKVSSIKEDKNVKDGKACVQGVLTGLTMLISKQRDVIDTAEKADDTGTADLLTAYVQEQEKLVWMYNAYLG